MNLNLHELQHSGVIVRLPNEYKPDWGRVIVHQVRRLQNEHVRTNVDAACKQASTKSGSA